MARCYYLFYYLLRFYHQLICTKSLIVYICNCIYKPIDNPYPYPNYPILTLLCTWISLLYETSLRLFISLGTRNVMYTLMLYTQIIVNKIWYVCFNLYACLIQKISLMLNLIKSNSHSPFEYSWSILSPEIIKTCVLFKYSLIFICILNYFIVHINLSKYSEIIHSKKRYAPCEYVLLTLLFKYYLYT